MTLDTSHPKVTVTLPAHTLGAARRQAGAAGLTLSAWLDRAARAEIRRHAAEALREHLAGPYGAETRDVVERLSRAARDYLADSNEAASFMLMSRLRDWSAVKA